MQAGGEKFEYIPALNDQPVHIDMLFDLINSQLHGWDVAMTADNTLRETLATAKGAEQ